MAQYEPNLPYSSIYADRGTYIRQPHLISNSAVTFEAQQSFMFERSGPSFNLSVDTYGDPKFLAQVSQCQPLRMEHVINSWKYEDKYKAQSILPFLYVGPMTAARDRAFIQSAGITMVIAIRNAAAVAVNPKIMDPARYALGSHITTATFDITDESDLIRRFRPVVKLINDHLKDHTTVTTIDSLNDIGGKVLVFCEAGDSRSPTLIVLYLMAVFGLETSSAIQVVQSQRFGILIADAYNRMIANTEQILSAERQVSGALNSTCKKRTIDQAWEEDLVMEDEDFDVAAARPGIAPFKATQVASGQE